MRPSFLLLAIPLALGGCLSISSNPPPRQTTVVVPSSSTTTTTVTCAPGTVSPC
jgi:hypothetical protein